MVESFIILLCLFIAVIYFFISVLFVHYGAKLAKIKNLTFVKSCIVTVVIIVISTIYSGIFLIIPLSGGFVSLVVSIILNILIYMKVFKTTINKAFFAWFFCLSLQVFAWVIIIFFFGGLIMSIL